MSDIETGKLFLFRKTHQSLINLIITHYDKIVGKVIISVINCEGMDLPQNIKIPLLELSSGKKKMGLNDVQDFIIAIYDKSPKLADFNTRNLEDQRMSILNGEDGNPNDDIPKDLGAKLDEYMSDMKKSAKKDTISPTRMEAMNKKDNVKIKLSAEDQYVLDNAGKGNIIDMGDWHASVLNSI